MSRTSSSSTAPLLRARLARLEAARQIMLEIRAAGIELRAFPERGRVGFKPRGLMPLALYRRLRAHEPLLLLLLTLPDIAIPLGAAPGVRETCVLCGANQWRNPVAWQCGGCHSLWRPLPAPVVAGGAPVTAHSAGTTEQDREAVAAGSA